MLAFGGDIGVYLLVTSLLITAAGYLSRKKAKVASLDDALSTSATQGAYIPLVIGRQRVGHVVLWVEDTTSLDGQDLPGSAPGLGKGSGNTPSQSSYTERALHGLCVGPASELRAIYQNNELIWAGSLTPDNTPSGSTIAVGSLEPNSSFRVYWGFEDDPVLPYLAASETHGVATRYSHCMKVLWDVKDLGSSRQWGRLEYEVVCPCYSQISTSPSQVPRISDANGIKWRTAQELVNGWSPTQARLNSGPRFWMELGLYPNDPAQGTTVQEQFRANRSLIFTDFTGFSAGGIPLLIPSGSIVALWISNTPTVQQVSLAASDFGLNNLNQLYLFKVVECYEIPDTPQAAYSGIVVRLGKPVGQADISLINFSGANTAAPTFSNIVSRIHCMPFDAVNTDGVNPVHMIDQLLFAKFPYGAGKDRTKFDAHSIDVAAEILQAETIRGGISIQDGEGVESSLSQIMQDITLMIPWNPETGLYTFRVIRYAQGGVALDSTILLKAPEVESIRGDRAVDTIAFTFKDRQRNYRDVPVKVADNGQIYENDTQRAQKVPIEVTQDRNSVARMAPRRAQEALGSLSTLRIEGNHGTIFAVAGSRVALPEIDVAPISYIISDVKRDVNSSKVEIGLLLDTYDPPSQVQLPLDTPPSAGPSSLEAAPLADFVGIEVPRLLSSDRRTVEVFFAGVRSSPKTLGTRIWGSRDDLTFTVLGDVGLISAGELAEELPGSGPAYDAGSYDIVADYTDDLAGVEDLTIYPDSWRAGRQILLVGDEVIFLQKLEVTLAATQEDPGAGTISGLIRGRAGTLQTTHPMGTPVFVLLSHRMVPTKSALFLPGRTIYFKGGPLELKKQGSIDGAASKSLALTGRALTPLKPSALRLGAFSEAYDVAEDPIRISWSYHSSEFPRTGLGHQTLGAATGISRPGGHFIVRIGSFETTTTDTFFELSAALRSSLGLDTGSNWTIEVEHVEGSFTSETATLTIHGTP